MNMPNSHSTVMALTRQYDLIDEEEEEHDEQIEATRLSDSDRALDGGGDEDTVQASGNRSSCALAGTATGTGTTRQAIRVAEIQDDIEIVDKEIEATMQKLSELQERRKVMVGELTNACRQNGTSVPVVPPCFVFKR